jgi:hypothetical protein
MGEDEVVRRFYNGMKDLQATRARYQSHKEFLQNCLIKRVVPNGFKLEWDMSVGTTADRKERCENILYDASLHLVRDTVHACEQKMVSTDLNMEQLVDNAPTSMSGTDVSSVVTDVGIWIEEG